MVVPRGKRSRGYLVHLTSIDNSRKVFDSGCLYADSCLPDQLDIEELGNRSIKTQRLERLVPCGVGGTVGDHVPFYFSARSPMLYFAHTGNPLSPFKRGQRELVHLLTHIDEVVRFERPFAFSDRNAAIGYADFSSDLNEIDHFIDWTLQDQRDWNNTPEYPDRMERRMAEFLVRDHLPVEAILAIGVKDEKQKVRVETVLADYPYPNVVVTPSWYY
jgi:hypothetical protein